MIIRILLLHRLRIDNIQVQDYSQFSLHQLHFVQNKKVENPHCPFCTNVGQTVSHLFVSCPNATSFWLEFIEWYQCISKRTLSLSKNEVIYGILNNWASCSPLNHIILIGKYFLNCRALMAINLRQRRSTDRHQRIEF